MFVFLILLSLNLFPLKSLLAQEPIKISSQIKQIMEVYEKGKYETARDKIELILEGIQSNPKNEGSDKKGFLFYWLGVISHKLQEYQKAVKYLGAARDLGYEPHDLAYEKAQAHFVLTQYAEAKIEFSKSVRKSFKKAVCLYYLGYIEQLQENYKKAVKFYRAIAKIDDEKREIQQAAEAQIGDIYFIQSEKQSDVLAAIESYVVPQYERAINLNPESSLASEIRKKILSIQQKYELVVLQMRNGRPTAQPPHFYRFTQESFYDTNPIFAATETTNEESKQASFVSKTDLFSKTTLYYKNMMSFSPELRFNFTRHWNRDEQIIRNDNWLLAPALRTSYEHTWGDKPASFVFDIDFNYSERDRNSAENFLFNSRVLALSVGERIKGLISDGETTVRLKKREFSSFSSSADSSTIGVSLDHAEATKSGAIYLFNLSYDQTRVTDNSFDTNTYFMRLDLILPQWGKFSPHLFFALTLTDPLNNPARGQETLIQPGFRFTRNISKRWRMITHAMMMKNNSKDTENFAYQKEVIGLDFEYLF
jgi:tetratricopeptide (TPR) repeat protein